MTTKYIAFDVTSAPAKINPNTEDYFKIIIHTEEDFQKALKAGYEIFRQLVMRTSDGAKYEVFFILVPKDHIFA